MRKSEKIGSGVSELGKLNKKDIRTTGVKNADELKQRYLLGHDYKEEIEASGKKLMASLEEKTEGLKELAFEQAPLSVSKGGTGATSFPSDSFLLGNGTSSLQTKTADEVAELLGVNKEPVLLWQNASVKSTFSGQTLNIDVSAYSFLLVIFTGYARWAEAFDSVVVPVGMTGDLFNTDTTIGHRKIRTSDTTKIVFTDGEYLSSYNGSYTPSNNMCVPYRIYGIE